jgi:hypothetical protein
MGARKRPGKDEPIDRVLGDDEPARDEQTGKITEPPPPAVSDAAGEADARAGLDAALEDLKATLPPGMGASDEAGAEHPHEPQVAPVYDADGRCLVCANAVLVAQLAAVGAELATAHVELERLLGAGAVPLEGAPAGVTMVSRRHLYGNTPGQPPGVVCAQAAGGLESSRGRGDLILVMVDEGQGTVALDRVRAALSLTVETTT